MSKITFEAKQLKFKFNEAEYNLNVTLSMRFISCFKENRYSFTDKELIKKCIISMNPDFSSIIDLLSKNQLLYIINSYIRKNKLSKNKVRSYSKFCLLVDLHIKKQEENIKKLFEENQAFKRITEKKELMRNTLENQAFKYLIEQQKNMLERLNEQIRKSIEPVIKMFEDFNNKIQNALKSIDLAGLRDSIDGMYILLIELEYPFIDLPIPDIRYIYEHRNDENIKEIVEDIILDNYSNEIINNLLTKWKNYKFIEKRIHLLEDSVWAFNNEKYTISIPIFFSQLEGIIADYFGCNGSMNGAKYKEYLDKILCYDENKDMIQDNIKDVTKKYFYNSVLSSFMHGNKIEKFSRHAIMHGGDVNYGTRINNINIIITFDMIIELINDMEGKSQRDG